METLREFHTRSRVGRKELLYQATLNQLAERLDPLRFVRVHRTAIVKSILRLEPISHGELEIILKTVEIEDWQHRS